MKTDKHAEDVNDEEFTKPLAVNSPVHSSKGLVFDNPTYSVCAVSLINHFIHACNLNRI